MPGPARMRVVLVGESPMVEELGMECVRAGHSVKGALNREKRPSGMTGGGRRALSFPAVSPAKALPRQSMGIELTNTDKAQKKENLRWLERSLPARSPILSSSVTVTAAEQAGWLQSPARLLGFSALPAILTGGNLIEVAPAPRTGEATLDLVRAFWETLGKEITPVQDRIGMVLPRIVCMLVNEALFAVLENVAPAHKIDDAMKLGANYPLGPVEWAGSIGFRQVLSVLESLQADLGEERYRIAPLLRRMALETPRRAT